MSRDISEKDWKTFRELREVALDRLCGKILGEARAVIERPGKTLHERYLSLFELIQDRDKDVARAFNDLRRSTAIFQLGVIRSMGLLTGEELLRFSPETQQMLLAFGPSKQFER